jgi:NCS1 family nucleobase:cation symporter-1
MPEAVASRRPADESRFVVSVHRTNGTGIARMEIRSIDHIPDAERHGKVRDQFTLWFGLNANIFPLILGGVLVFIGLSFWWACIAIVLGTTIGLILVGFHAIQGPTLGIPQMTQSRGQFGFYGAVLVFAASIALDVGFLAAQLVIQGQAAHLVYSGISVPQWIAIFTVPVVILTLYGYDWIHRWQRWMTPILGITFIVIFIQALHHGALEGAAASTQAPSLASFMTATGLFVIAIVGWAPYVSDYSRYLPATVSKARTFWAVTLGCMIPTIACGVVGAYIAGLLPNSDSTVVAVRDVAGTWAIVILALSLVGPDVAESYTGMLALVSIASCFRDVRNSLAVRVAGSLVIIGAGAVLALLGYRDFINHLTDFLNALLLVFIPWTAINLTDFYVVRHGEYDIPSFFTPHGRYGGFLWRGIIAYLLALAIELPFMDQAFYTGPLVHHLAGVDISWVVGGIAGIVLYLIAVRIPDQRRPESVRATLAHDAEFALMAPVVAEQAREPSTLE